VPEPSQKLTGQLKAEKGCNTSYHCFFPSVPISLTQDILTLTVSHCGAEDEWRGVMAGNPRSKAAR
jgi:hypothetical protein